MERGARTQKISFKAKIGNYFRLHKMEINRSIYDLLKSPVANFMTMLVLGIALALPSGLHVVLKNSQQLSESWDNATQISLFLVDNITDEAAKDFADSLKKRPEISEVSLINADKALEDFKQFSGFGNALQHLSENPLPPLVIVTPSMNYTDPDKASELAKELGESYLVDIAQLDVEWVRKLYAMLLLAERTVSALSMLLGLAVILIVGNTIRLSIQSRKEEIEIIKLVGATNTFIRRPFLYGGLWYGLGGAFIAWILVMIALFWMQDPIKDLSGLYSSNFELSHLNAGEVIRLLAFGGVLGWLGSWVSVAKHLKDIKPS
jgi:cell division transport system permease protein